MNVQPKKEFDFRYFIPLTVSLLSLAAQVFALLVFLIGTTELLGKTFSIATACIYLFRIIRTNSATSFSHSVGFISSVFYFLFLGFMIKNFIVGVRVFLDLKESRFSLYSRKYNSIRFSKLMYEFLLSFELVCIEAISVCFCGGRLFYTPLILLMIFTGLVYVGRGIALHIFQYDFTKTEYLLPDGVKDALVFASLCLTVFLLNRPLIRDFYVGLFMLLTENMIGSSTSVAAAFAGLYYEMVFPICFFCILPYYFIVIHEYLPHGMRRYDVIPRIKKVLVHTIVFAVIHLMLAFLFMGRFSFPIFYNWFTLMRKTYLPIIVFFSVLLWLESNCRTKRYIS